MVRLHPASHVVALSVMLALAAAPTASAAPADTAAAPASGTSDSSSDIPDQVSLAHSILARLQRTTITGYLQARATYIEEADPSSNFSVRRARLGLRHSLTSWRFVFSFDGGQNSVSVKDAYFDWFITKDRGQTKGTALRAGQFQRPFGYEIERSSSEREFMERATAWGVLFPGNRDVGFDLSYGITPAWIVNAAIVNGSGSSSEALPSRDPDEHKDVMARVRYSLFSPRIELSASAYVGEQTIPGAAAIPPQLGFVDANGNGVQDAGEETVVSAPGRAAVPAITGDRNRYGVGTIVSDLAGGTLRAEALLADDLTTNLGPGASRKEAPASAWYAQYVHAIAGPFSGGFRYDRFDPDTDDAVRLGGDGETDTYAVIAMFEPGENVRWTIEWDHFRAWNYDRTVGGSTQHDSDQFTLQGQVKF